MKELDTMYETPQVEVIEIEVEQGFAASDQNGQLNDLDSNEGGW